VIGVGMLLLLLLLSVHPTMEPVASMSWHMENEQQLITCTNNGIVELVQLRESIPLCWGPLASFVCTRGTQILETSTETAGLQDISTLMRARVMLGYSMDV
jgi:hypothetical protein